MVTAMRSVKTFRDGPHCGSWVARWVDRSEHGSRLPGKADGAWCRVGAGSRGRGCIHARRVLCGGGPVVSPGAVNCRGMCSWEETPPHRGSLYFPDQYS